jgi:hypothetical protein
LIDVLVIDLFYHIRFRFFGFHTFGILLVSFFDGIRMSSEQFAINGDDINCLQLKATGKNGGI